MQIKDIAEVISGYTFRKAMEPNKNGNMFVFQAKNIVQGEPFTKIKDLTKILYEVAGHTNFLKENDVVIVARGMKSGSFRTTVFKLKDQDIIASSSVHIIRINSNKILPEYLSYYLNSQQGQKDLSGEISGSYIGALPRKNLSEIKIPIPDLKKQKAIINLYENIKEQEKITATKIKIKENIINTTFKNLINK